MKFILLMLFLVTIIGASKDLYDILGISKDASEKEVKSAFRQLSKKFHPDKNPSPEADEIFIEINEAYEILSNPEKKANYDKFGDPEGPRQHGVDFGDIFHQFFGGGQQQRGPRKGEDTQANLHIGLRDFYSGKDIEFDVEMLNICEHCKGTGSEDQQTHTCSKCGGHGMIQMRRQLGPGMIQTFNTQCDECGGLGQQIKNKCQICHGDGTKPTSRHYNIYIPPGFKRDDHHILEGEGDQNPSWVPGNLIIAIREDFKDSWGYRRTQENLYRTEVLTLKEALNGGWERIVPFFDSVENELVLKRDPGVVTIDGEFEVIKGKGMPILHHLDIHGDLYIEYKVIYPLDSRKTRNDEL